MGSGEGGFVGRLKSIDFGKNKEKGAKKKKKEFAEERDRTPDCLLVGQKRRNCTTMSPKNQAARGGDKPGCCVTISGMRKTRSDENLCNRAHF